MRRLIILMLGAVLVGCTSTPGSITTTTTSTAPVTRSPLASTTTEPSVAGTTSSLATTSTGPVLPTLASEPIEIGPLAPRGGHSVVWTGHEVIVWGGEGDETGRTLYSDGAAYEPETGRWRKLSDSPLSPRRYHVAVWTGKEMVVVGGVSTEDGAAYDPGSDSWRPIAPPPIPVTGFAGIGIEGRVGAVWTGDELVIWLVTTDRLAAYDPHADRWRSLPATGLAVDNGALRWDGESVYAFGATVSDYPATNDLSVSRLRGGEWESLPSTGFSTDEYTIGALATLTAWTGDRFLAWSGSGREAPTKALDTRTAAWEEAKSVPSSPCEGQGEPVSANGLVFAFGGCDSELGIYDASTDAWTVAPVGGYPTARYTVWTGDRLVNWGDTCCYGSGGEGFTVTAWSYQPDD